MNKMSFKNVILRMFFLVVPMLFLSCTLEDNSVDFHFVNLKVVDVELPESFKVYETYQVRVTYLKPNNCTFFEGFDITKPDTTVRNVVAIGSELDDASCSQVAEEVVESFYFTCYYHDTYTFRFWTGEDENGVAQFLEYEVPVDPDPRLGP